MKKFSLTLSALSLIFLAACTSTILPPRGENTQQPPVNDQADTGGAMMKKEDAKEGTAMMSVGEYKDHTAGNLPASVLTDGKTKVLYFFASWCPTCKKSNQTLTSWYADGKGMLTVYKINYDEEKTLEQKYGVTYQHTFVKVDGQGNMIEKIQGPSDDELKRLLQS